MAAAVAILVLLFLGMSLAAARELAGRCHTTQDCLAVAPGQCLEVSPGNALLTGTQTTRCELGLWDVRIRVSEKAADILQRLGVRFTYN